MQRSTQEDMSIPGSVFDCQPARRVPEESYNDSRNLVASSGIQRREGIEKSGSEEPLQPLHLLCFSGKAEEKVWTTEIVLSLWLTMPRVSGLVLKSGMVTQLPITEFFLGCIYTKDPLDRSVPPPTHAHAYSASLPQPSDNATVYSPSSTSRTSDRHVLHHGPRARLHSAPPPPPGLEDQTHLSSSHGIPGIAVPVRPCTHTSTSAPSPQPHVSTAQVGTHHAGQMWPNQT